MRLTWRERTIVFLATVLMAYCTFSLIAKTGHADDDIQTEGEITIDPSPTYGFEFCTIDEASMLIYCVQYQENTDE